MTVLVPLIGWAVIFNENLQNYFELSRHIFGDGEILGRVSWRLLCIYFALCFLGAGSTIYHFACPETIKQFATSIDYIAATRAHMGDVMLGRMEGRLKSDPLSSHEFEQLQSLARQRAEQAQLRATPHDRRAGAFFDAPSSEAAAARAGVYDQYWRDLLELNFRTDEQRRSVARLGVLALYVVGFIVLAVPSIDVFWRVTMVGLRTLLS
jgi:hypothetical protein